MGKKRLMIINYPSIKKALRNEGFFIEMISHLFFHDLGTKHLLSVPAHLDHIHTCSQS